MNNNDDDDDDDFPLKDEVFITYPPIHEVVVSDPLEEIGVVDERDKNLYSQTCNMLFLNQIIRLPQI